MSHTYGQDLNGKWLLRQMGVGKMKKTPVQHLLDIENENDFEALYEVAKDPLILKQHPSWDRYKNH